MAVNDADTRADLRRLDALIAKGSRDDIDEVVRLATRIAARSGLDPAALLELKRVELARRSAVYAAKAEVAEEMAALMAARGAGPKTTTAEVISEAEARDTVRYVAEKHGLTIEELMEPDPPEAQRSG
jgi:hypothetical protein